MIHQYKLGGFNIVLDICSGSIHVVDEVAYDIIAAFQSKSREAVIEEISKKILKKSKYFFIIYLIYIYLYLYIKTNIDI